MESINTNEPLMQNQAQQPQSRNDKKLAKYGDDMANFTVANNSNITEGVVKERKVTDFGCLILFLGLFVTMAMCTVYGFKKGDVPKYLAPIDGLEQFCGIDPEVKEYPKMFLTDLLSSPTQIFKSGVCVKECPKSKTDSIACAPGYENVYPYNLCGTVNVYDTHTMLDYCLPDIGALKRDYPEYAETWSTAFKQMLSSNPAGNSIQDLYLSSRAIYWSMAMSFVYCILYIYILSAFAEYIAWALIGFIQIALIGVSGLSIVTYMSLRGTNDPNEKNALIGSVAFPILALMFCVAVWCGFNSLRIAINVIDASADFIAKTKRIIGVPVLYFFVTLLFVLVWLFCVMSINTIGDITPATDLFIQGRLVDRDNKDQSKTVAMLLLFMFFGILWIMAFIRAKTSFIVMVSACTYYFDSNKDRDGYSDVGMGFQLAYKNHAGSLAFGSCIIAII
jgi:solute carrier family 44 protein 1 (choline transporter-like protein)/choline transporter-like protein 2/4/5